MKVLGFRGNPKAPRYAVLSYDGTTFTLGNASSDNKLTIPASIGEDADGERLKWIHAEIVRILEAHPDIVKVMIKTNEFTQSDTKPKRKSAYIDAAVLLAAALKNVPVQALAYNQMSATKAKTKELAEARVGKTDKYWDEGMADAINVAWWGALHP
jgi:Holliday junction resolvasome RuvABC endonuclease subunit